MDNENRLKYYLGELFYNKIQINSDFEDFEDFKDFKLTRQKILKVNKINLERSPISTNYKEILDFIHDDKFFLYVYGDIRFNIDLPVFTKNRNSTNCKSILFKSFNFKRHWNINNLNLAINDNLEKINKCLWRGVTTGFSDGRYEKPYMFDRLLLVEQYFNKSDLIDVGFNKICHKREELCEQYLKDFVPIEEQLKYRFLISVEGNDVATDLKWKLLSKSVVLMKQPTKFTWLMEDKLIPDYHYILLKDDFSDLEEKLEWAINNPEIVDNIIKNANDYMSIFMDEENELYLQNKIIEIYFQNIEFI